MKLTCTALILCSLLLASHQVPVVIPNDVLSQDATYGVPAGGVAGINYFQTKMVFGYDTAAKKPVTIYVVLDLAIDQIILGSTSKIDCSGDFCTPSTTPSSPYFQGKKLTATSGTIAAGFLNPSFDYSQKINVVQTAYNNVTNLPLTTDGVVGINAPSIFMAGLSKNYKLSSTDTKPFLWFTGSIPALSNNNTFNSIKVN